MDDKRQNTSDVTPSQEFPGIAENIANNDEVNECLEKQDVRQLNNNPRNNELNKHS